jgi:Zn-dependent protease with chaperone function
MVDVAGVPPPVNAPGAEAFAHEGELIWLALQLVPVALAAALLLTGASARLTRAFEQISGGRRFKVIVLMGWAWLVVTGLLTLPLRALDHARWARWGIPMDWPAWLAGQGMQVAAGLGATALLLWLPFALIRGAPRLWPMWAALLATPTLAAGLVAMQVLVQPMLTSYRPLDDASLRAAIQSMAERCGAGPVPVLVGGDDETVVGLGPTSRILISPDSLKSETRAELLTTLAHELKHFRMGDNWLAIGVVGGLVLAGGLLVQLLGGVAIKAFGARFGFGSLADPASLPLMVLILTAAWAIAGLPIFNAVQRHVELEADRFALEVTHDNRALAEQQAAAGKGPWRMNVYDEPFRIWFATHPSQSERVQLADHYAPWMQGRAGRYDKVCRPAPAGQDDHGA